MEKNLQSEKAIKKLQDLITEIRTCVFITSGKTGTHASRPMAVVDVDADGNVWFYTRLQSNKVKDIELEHHVELVFAHPGKDRYLHVQGRAGLVTDQSTIRDKWTPIVKAWFPGGVDDPQLCLLKIKTDEAHYWDTESTKMEDILKIAASIISGKQLVDGVHGELHV